MIVTLDGDCQNDPADIQKFVDEYHRTKTALNSQKTCCLVIGHRLLRRDTGWRKFSSYTAKIARRSLLGDDTPDSGCGLKAFSRETFMTLPRFNHMHRFLPTLIKQRGGEVVSMAVNHRERLSGNSHYGTLDRLFVGLDDLMGVLWLGRRAIPPNTISEDY